MARLNPPAKEEEEPEEEGYLEEIEEKFQKRLLECCEKASLAGVSDQDIYKILISPFHLNIGDEEQLTNGIRVQVKNKGTETGNSSSREFEFKKSKKNNGILLILIILPLLALFVHFLIGISSSFHFHYGKYLLPSELKERRCLLPSHPLLMEMVRPIANCSICGTFHNVLIEMDDVPSKESFREIAYSSRPIIIRGALRLQTEEGNDDDDEFKFTFKRLKEIFESEEGGVDTVSNECQFLPFRSPFTSLRNAFDRISNNSEEIPWSQPWYIGWSNCHPGVASKLRKIVPRPSFLPEDSGPSAIDWIFIGSPGLGAAMHIDYVRRPSWQAQLSGVKTWMLRPPPECESFCPEELIFTIYPGDLLFLETNTWYHQTYIEGDELSISIGSEYD